MKIFVLLSLIYFLFLSSAFSQSIESLEVRVALQIGGDEPDSGNTVVVDLNGDFYIVGIFKDTVDFGDTTLFSLGKTDTFLSKYDSLGNLIWVRSIGGTKTTIGVKAVIDTKSNVYILGNFSGISNFGDSLIESNGTSVFLVKYNSKGDLKWTRTGMTTSMSSYGDICIDSKSFVYVVGSFFNKLSFGTDTIYADHPSKQCNFITKFDNNGDNLWLQLVLGDPEQGTQGLAIDGKDKLYYVGTLVGRQSLLDQYKSGADENPKFKFVIAKYNTRGHQIWTEVVSGDNHIYPTAIVTDQKGGVYITGVYLDNMIFGERIIRQGGEKSRIFISKYSKNGKNSWVNTSEGNTNLPISTTLACDKYGKIYLGGTYSSGSIEFGKKRITSNHEKCGFIMEFDYYGNVVNLFSVGNSSSVGDVSVDKFGGVFVTGWFTDDSFFDFKSGKKIGAGDCDSFLLKYR